MKDLKITIEEIENGFLIKYEYMMHHRIDIPRSGKVFALDKRGLFEELDKILSR